VRILVDLKGVGPIASASPLVCDWVDVVRMDFVDLSVDVIGNENLTSVNHAIRAEGTVLESLPFGM